MPFDPSCVHQFSVLGDTTNVYAMIDERLVTEALEGLTTTQAAAVNAYRVPFQEGFPAWAGHDPAAVYFKTTLTKMKVALKKRWTD